MSYEPEVLRRAYERLQENQRQRTEAFEARKAKIYRQAPPGRGIDPTTGTGSCIWVWSRPPPPLSSRAWIRPLPSAPCGRKIRPFKWSGAPY